MSKGLNPKQRLFVKNYLLCKNATQAAMDSGYSKKTAHAIGRENLHKPALAKAIEDGLKAQEAAIEKKIEKKLTTKEEWLAMLDAQMKADLTDLYTIQEGPDGKPKLKLSLIDVKQRGLGKLIKKIKWGKDGQPEFELHSREFAMELMAKARGWITEQVEISSPKEKLTENDFDEIFKNQDTQAWALKIAHATNKIAKKPQGEKQ